MMKVIPNLKVGYTTMVFPDFVGLFGLQHFALSMEALKYFTQFGSSEFAVREFLKRDLQKTLKVMHEWSVDDNVHVRRLSSEGSRPRLPWSFKLDAIIADPSLSRPILENLKADSELYVKKSVANHLNDIAKDTPDYVHKIIKVWDQSNPHTAWIVKRGVRSLLKNGDRQSLTLLGMRKAKVSVKNLVLDKTVVKLDENLIFSFDLVSDASTAQKVMLYYRIHYVKKSGATSPKIFKLREMSLDPGARVTINKKQRFQDFTTRVHHSGMHALEILVNGDVIASARFRFKR
jgi:3-methyladenine DNA glycosylase AlkC